MLFVRRIEGFKSAAGGPMKQKDRLRVGGCIPCDGRMCIHYLWPHEDRLCPCVLTNPDAKPPTSQLRDLRLTLTSAISSCGGCFSPPCHYRRPCPLYCITGPTACAGTRASPGEASRPSSSRELPVAHPAEASFPLWVTCPPAAAAVNSTRVVVATSGTFAHMTPSLTSSASTERLRACESVLHSRFARGARMAERAPKWARAPTGHNTL